MGKPQDDEAVRNGLKVFVGGLPDRTPEQAVGQHFSRYGHVESVLVCPPKEGEKKAPYAFAAGRRGRKGGAGEVTFRFAADADCAVVDTQNFPGATRPLAMSFAAKKGWVPWHGRSFGVAARMATRIRGLLASDFPSWSHGRPKTEGRRSLQGGHRRRGFSLRGAMWRGINDRDNEEEIGDFFSQWGLAACPFLCFKELRKGSQVALVHRDKANWGRQAAVKVSQPSLSLGARKSCRGFIRYATKEGANRVLEEERVQFQRREPPNDVLPGLFKAPGLLSGGVWR